MLSVLTAFHNEKEKHKLNENTQSHYETTQRYLMEYVRKAYNKKDIPLKDINFMFISGFENFLRDYKPEGNKKAIRNSGAMTHLIRLKKMLNLAINIEWMVRNPFRGYKIKIRHEERQYLTKEELAKLEKKKFTPSRLDYVRDLIIFCCYTGLAYIDAVNLTPANLVKGVDNELWIKTRRHKTLVALKRPCSRSLRLSLRNTRTMNGQSPKALYFRH